VCGRSSATKDLRSFLADVERERPQALLRIDRPISCGYEITALQAKMEARALYPVMLFERPTRLDGQPSRTPVVTNLTASRELCAWAIGIDPRRVAEEYSARVAERIPPVVVPRGRAPVKEVVWTGDEVDLFRLPLMIHQEIDPGAYLTAAYAVTVDPGSGVDNSAIQRFFVRHPRRLGYWPAPTSHAAWNLRAWWARGEDMPMALWFGHHPAALAGGQVRLGHPESHWPAMGGALGEPLRLVPSECFGERLLVPADAEIVVEGVVPREVYEAEAPFGEFTGYAGPQRPSPVFDVRAVTMRRDAIFHDYGVGFADMLILGNFPLEARIYEMVKKVVPEVRNVHVPLSGHRFHVYIQVRKTRPGIGRDCILAAMPCDPRPKHFIVVDEDVDIFDEKQVLWAVATRTQWDRDLVVVPGQTVYALDPSVPAPGQYGTKGGIDATMPPPLDVGLPQQYPAVNRVPQAVAERVAVEDYVPAERLRALPNG
jgi:2,5-furandicarboxylate decarboxylase 1